MLRLCSAVGLAAGLALATSCGGSTPQDNSTRDESGTVIEAGEVATLALRVGDCLASASESDSSASDLVPVVPCSDAHESEVFATSTLPDGDFPGVEAVTEMGRQRCGPDRLVEYAGPSGGSGELAVSLLVPSGKTWDAADDREVLCLVVRADGMPLNGSVRDRAA